MGGARGELVLRVREGIRKGTRKGSWGGGVILEGTKGRVRTGLGTRPGVGSWTYERELAGPRKRVPVEGRLKKGIL